MIDIYQRHLSPHKGFRCAYAVQHGGPGCSGYAKQTLSEVGFWQAIPNIKSRFAECKTAARNLQEQKKNKKKPKDDGRPDMFDCCFVVSDGPSCAACFSRTGASKKSGVCDGDCTPDCAPDCCNPFG